LHNKYQQPQRIGPGPTGGISQVIRKRLGRISAAITIGALLGASAIAGPVAAKNPTWVITPVRLPVTVAPGKDAGYFVTVTNAGTSTINGATLTVTPSSTPNATPTYFSGLTYTQGGPQISCTSTGKLVCQLGTLASLDSFTFTVAYNVPASTSNKFTVTFSLEASTGNVGGKNQSRGDRLDVASDTTVNSSSNFSGGFVKDDGSFATTGNLGRNNKQNSQADVTDSLVTVNVEDGITTDPGCTDPSCAHVIGEWTKLNVPNNQEYIKLTLNIWGGSVPGGVSEDDIFLVHVRDDGTNETITAICADPTAPPASGECITVTKVGNNYRIVAWLLHNGALRGTW
jgi:hypothetical protein